MGLWQERAQIETAMKREESCEGCVNFNSNSWRFMAAYPRIMQPSSTLLLACSQALRASSPSTVPPRLPSGRCAAVVCHVLTTKEVLDSRGYEVFVV